jgi:lysophospholipase L1-like esterase
MFGAQIVQAQVSTPVKWSCIGNSITQGIYATYEGKLDTLLGTNTVTPGFAGNFTIENDGVSSMTLLKSGRSSTTDAAGAYSYWTHGKLANVFAFQPDVITIMLGTNDSKRLNWADSANFVRDYTALVDTLSAMTSHPQIWLCLPCPCWSTDTSAAGIRGTVIKNGVIPRIQQVATAKGLNTIDCNTPLTNSSALFPDAIHPNNAGCDSLARIIYRAYFAKAFRVVCIGNSITQCDVTAGNKPVDAYASKLNMLLGRDYLVENDGVSGMLMQKHRSNFGLGSYWDCGRFPHIFAFKPNLITIMLGTNDARPDYWNTTLYIRDYKAMIDTLASSITPKPAIKLCLPIPSWQVNGAWPFAVGAATNGINNNLLRDSVLPAVKAIALAKGLSIIDLNTPLLNAMPSLIPASDGVHLNPAGQDTVAHIIYRNLTVSAMHVSDTVITLTAVTGQTDTTGTAKIDSVTNLALLGSLANITALHKSTWLTCTVNSTAPNSQKITNALSMGSLPATAGTYRDTVILTATNAAPTTIKYIVVLTLQQGSGVLCRSFSALNKVPEITVTGAGLIKVSVPTTGRNTVSLMTLSGECTNSRTFIGAQSVILEPKTPTSGVYIVRVISQGGQTVFRKIVNIVRN